MPAKAKRGGERNGWSHCGRCFVSPATASRARPASAGDRCVMPRVQAKRFLMVIVGPDSSTRPPPTATMQTFVWSFHPSSI